MKIRAGYTITFDSNTTTPINLIVSVHPDRRGDLVTPDELKASTPCRIEPFVDSFGNIVSRVLSPPGPVTFSSDFVISDSGEPDVQALSAREVAIEDLPGEALQFLLSSRYCEVDQMSDLAWSLFGGVEPGWARVTAILDYAHKRIAFNYQNARGTRSAYQGHEERTGVCRDYAHLAITLCRAMSIPARYCTGYLGDIGVPASPAPMDFSAWFEVYLDGGWITVDARHNRPRIGRILIARGRDAADVAISTTFGTTWLTRFEVVTDEIPEHAAQGLMAAE